MEQRRHLECTLGPEELVDRRAACGDVAAALVDRVRTENGFRARFRRSPDISDALSALVAAERDCCGWASWALSDEGNCVVLDVTGPPDRIGALAAAFES
ncbi:MAG: hypothetical protein KY452_08420 [Actinobacteria bacterium]|nr:hypothetical protein [Actinomycetota bacterium]